jgi:hypothetical protein
MTFEKKAGDRQQLDQSEACVAPGTSTTDRDHAVLLETP